MVKFKGRSGIKQYIKSKPIKWSFKFWFYCLSKSGYLYLMYIYLGRKQTAEFNLNHGEEVVLLADERRRAIVLHFLFWQLFNSPKLIEKLFQKSTYGIGTVRANRKQMPKMIDDKQMKREDRVFLFSGNWLQWLVNG